MKSLVFPALLLLSGCATIANPPSLAQNEAGRAEYLKAHANWAFTGRLAYAHAGKGGSARIRWQQDGDTSDVLISGPLAMGSARLRFNTVEAQVLDADGRPVKTGTPEALLAELLQVPAPLPELPQGLRAFWPDRPEYNAAAAAGTLQIAAWTWQYADWRNAPVRLPGKIEIANGQTRLRLVIDQWQERPRD